jgi:hypothetical protein
MASTIAVTSGSIAVYNSQTKFEETDQEKLKELESKAKTLKFGEAELKSIFKIKEKRGCSTQE